MIAAAALELWTKGREFPYLSSQEKSAHFQCLKNSHTSLDDDERGWAIEALYRLLWDFSAEQREEAILLLISSIIDPNPKCAERAVKGMQFALEFMNTQHAEGVLEKLKFVTTDSPEIMQVVAIEIAYSLYTLFSETPVLMQEVLEVLLHLESINPEWMKRTVPSTGRLHSQIRTLTEGVTLPQIGVVRNGYSTLRQMDDFDVNTVSKIHVWPEYAADLRGIETLTHVVVVCHLDEQRPLEENSSVRQKLKHNPDFGQFATSHPLRRNAVFYKTGAFAGIEGSTVLVRGIRVLDMTPVLDIRAANIHDLNGLSLCASKE